MTLSYRRNKYTNDLYHIYTHHLYILYIHIIYIYTRMYITYFLLHYIHTIIIVIIIIIYMCVNIYIYVLIIYAHTWICLRNPNEEKTLNIFPRGFPAFWISHWEKLSSHRFSKIKIIKSLLTRFFHEQNLYLLKKFNKKNTTPSSFPQLC